MGIFSSLIRSTRPGRTRTAKPTLEQLDDRLVPSTVGLSSAISVNHGGSVLHDWFTINQSTGKVVEYEGTTQHNLNGPSNVLMVSASVDPQTGSAGVFALGVNGQLWWCSSGGSWNQLPGQYLEMCATGDGHVYAVGFNGDMYYLASNGSSTDLGTPQDGILPDGMLTGLRQSYTLAASTSLSGGNEVFALNVGGKIYVNSANAQGQWSHIDATLGRLSGLSAAPNNTLFATSIFGELFEESETLQVIGEHTIGRYIVTIYGYVWTRQDISSGMVWTQISADLDASGKAEVYGITNAHVVGSQNDGTAYVYDQGILTYKDSSVVDISGANGGYFYDVNYYAPTLNAYQYSPTARWTFLASGFE